MCRAAGGDECFIPSMRVKVGAALGLGLQTENSAQHAEKTKFDHI